MRAIRKTGIRLPESLCLKLEREASRHRVSFNREVQMRLEDSLENKDAPRTLDAIQEDMRIVWGRLSNRLMALQLEEEFVRTVLQSTDMTVVAFANSWLMHHAQDRELDRKDKEMAADRPGRPGQPKWKPHWEAPSRKDAARPRPSIPVSRKEFEATMRAAKPRTFKKGEIKKGEIS
jgi:hypothetical protein